MKPYAKIHHYDQENITDFDDDGDLRLGWYFQFIGENGEPTTGLFGPYDTDKECEAAALEEWSQT